MSLNWQWSDRMGKAVHHNGQIVNIYQGNAYMIGVYEQENTYQLAWFAADKDHFKNLLGLNKAYPDNSFADFGIKELHLDLRYKSVPEIISLIAKSKTPVTIILYIEVEEYE